MDLLICPLFLPFFVALRGSFSNDFWVDTWGIKALTNRLDTYTHSQYHIRCGVLAQGPIRVQLKLCWLWNLILSPYRWLAVKTWPTTDPRDRESCRPTAPTSIPVNKGAIHNVCGKPPAILHRAVKSTQQSPWGTTAPFCQENYFQNDAGGLVNFYSTAIPVGTCKVLHLISIRNGGYALPVLNL